MKLIVASSKPAILFSKKEKKKTDFENKQRVSGQDRSTYYCWEMKVNRVVHNTAVLEKKKLPANAETQNTNGANNSRF